MSKLQILVTTMHQTDFRKIEQMNIRSDVVFANQADRYGYEFTNVNGFKAEMVTTATRGLSKNRNLAIEYSAPDADYIMFSDDDLVFSDNYEELILKEFEAHPKACVIKFNLYDMSKTRKISMKKIEHYKKATRLNVSSSGVCGLVIRRQALIKYNLRFNEYFGTGTENYCGEDSIFLQEIINKKIPFYLSPIEIAGIDQTETSWFEGYNDKYFRVTGRAFATMYPKASKLLAIRSSYRFSKRKNCNMKFKEILKCYYNGINDFLNN